MLYLASALWCGSSTQEVVVRPLGTACQHFIGLSDYTHDVLLHSASVLPSHSRKYVYRSNRCTEVSVLADGCPSNNGHPLCLEVF